jgi:hypothetical protein
VAGATVEGLDVHAAGATRNGIDAEKLSPDEESLHGLEDMEDVYFGR